MDAKEVDSLLQPVRWTGSSLEILDQTKLPATHTLVSCSSAMEVGEAIQSMKVRGAPAIGVTAAYGFALAAIATQHGTDLKANLSRAYDLLLDTRPTAVNLQWALDRMMSTYQQTEASNLAKVRERLTREAISIHDDSFRSDRQLSELGANLLAGHNHILTHCNAGPLATAGYGTAIGVIRRSYELNSAVTVLADETRPFLQGSRLTAWELMTLGIPVTVIADNMAGHMMCKGEVDAVVVGADRIAANGDVANKIGTYPLAVLAQAHTIPFYVAAPISTIDPTMSQGSLIPIEERDPDEVTAFQGIQVAPLGASARHPAFDVTPARYITAIITEAGVATAPYQESLRDLVGNPAHG